MQAKIANPPRKCCSNFKSIDFFGERVEFTFKKSPVFQTNLGASISILCFILMMMFLTLRTMKLIDDKEPFFSSTTFYSDQMIDLWELGFTFAIENIDPTFGSVYAYHTKWGADEDRSQRIETPINLVDCNELSPGGAYES